MVSKVTIIGGGPAGYEAAIIARSNNAEVTIIENNGVGGACVLYDCVPSKTFIASTGVRTEMRRAQRLGVAVIDEHDIDLISINTRVKELALRQSEDIRKSILDMGVRIIDGRASFIERPQENSLQHFVKARYNDNGAEEVLLSNFVLIATGASPRVLPGAVPDGERILNWRHVYDLKKLPQHLIVVGSGVTGSEFVHAFTEMGVEVTVLSSTGRMLPREDEDAAHVLENILSERGVTLVRDAKAETVARDGDGVVVTLSTGQQIRGSHALMTVGSIPNTANLGLEHVGVELKPGGYIDVDRVSRTCIPGIYAAGDCTGVFPLASVAAMQGRVAMYHAMGDQVTPIKLRTIASAVFTRPEIASVGVPQALINNNTFEGKIVVLPLASNPRAKMSGFRRGFVKIFCHPSTEVVIGAVVVAPNASELIAPLSLAVENNLTIQSLASTFTVYPSLSGSINEAARRLIKYDDLN